MNTKHRLGNIFYMHEPKMTNLSMHSSSTADVTENIYTYSSCVVCIVWLSNPMEIPQQPLNYKLQVSNWRSSSKGNKRRALHLQTITIKYTSTNRQTHNCKQILWLPLSFCIRQLHRTKFGLFVSWFLCFSSNRIKGLTNDSTETTLGDPSFNMCPLMCQINKYRMQTNPTNTHVQTHTRSDVQKLQFL